MQSKKPVFLLLLLLVLLVSSGFGGWYWGHRAAVSEVAFVYPYKVYDDFNLTKELQANLEQLRSQRQQIVDSLHVQVLSLERQLQEQGDPGIQEQYQAAVQRSQQVQEQFERDFQQTSERYERTIWNRLNTYTKEFGKQRGYQLILGATGGGGLMHADEGLDVTEELTAFINQEYAGDEGQ